MKSKPSSVTLRSLGRHESPNVTFMDPDGTWPIVWQRAKGMHVWDETGRRYLDLTAAFGVAACGHAPKQVVEAGQKQLGCLMHAMGDVHPHALKAQLLTELSRWTYERWYRRDARAGGRKPEGSAKFAKSILCNSGFEAVEAALKTAHLATGRSGVVAFSGAYHGLGYGALTVTHRSHFRRPFQSQLKPFSHFLKYPSDRQSMKQSFDRLERLLKKGTVGAILVEAIQSRAGLRMPPEGFLPGLRERCHAHGALLILDEIYTGFGRTGDWTGSRHWGVQPDMAATAKAITNGYFPFGAVMISEEIAQTFEQDTTGTANIGHGYTYSGHPLACAAAIATADLYRDEGIFENADAMSRPWEDMLHSLADLPGVIDIRNMGLVGAVQLESDETVGARGRAAFEKLWDAGVSCRPIGDSLAMSPPLIVTEDHIGQIGDMFRRVLAG